MLAKKAAASEAEATLVVLDSSCWLEFLMDTERADLFAPQIEHPKNLLVPVITIYVVVKKLAHELGDDIASSALVLMQRSRVVDIDLALTTQALRNGLQMADSLIFATTRSYGATLWTQDQHFKGLPGVLFFEKSS